MSETEAFQFLSHNSRMSAAARSEDLIAQCLRLHFPSLNIAFVENSYFLNLPDIAASGVSDFFYVEAKSCQSRCCSFTVSREHIYRDDIDHAAPLPPYEKTPYFTAFHASRYIGSHCTKCGKIWLLNTSEYRTAKGDPPLRAWHEGRRKPNKNGEMYTQPYIWIDLNSLAEQQIASVIGFEKRQNMSIS